MKAVILVGGLGTRLRPLSYNTPKAMMPVLNTPFLEWVIKRLKRHGFDEPVLAISHLAEPIQGYFGDGSRFGVRLSYSVEQTGLGTAGGVKNAESYLGNEPFAVLNGDIFTDLDVSAMLAFHKKHQAQATIALTPVEDPTQYGLVEADAGGKITRFLEKPARDQITTNMINAGTYILEPEVLASIPGQTCFSFEHQVFPALLERGVVYAFPSRDYWMDIGTPEKYRQLNIDLLCAKSNQFQLSSGICIQQGKNNKIHPSASITGPVMLGDNNIIGENVRLEGPLVLGSNNNISNGAFVSSSVIWDDVSVGCEAKISASVVAGGCEISGHGIVEDSVMAHRAKLAGGGKLSGASVMPDKAVG